MNISQSTIDEVRRVSDEQNEEKFVICWAYCQQHTGGSGHLGVGTRMTTPGSYESCVTAINQLYSSDMVYWIQRAQYPPSIQSACWLEER